MATKKPLLPFWNALDEIPNATTDRREWSLRLGNDWSIAAAYLKPTGRLVREVSCPSPGGDGCPRKVIKHANDRFRAVCGMRPAECDAIDVTRDQLTCLTLDRAKLVSLTGAVFGTDQECTSFAGHQAWTCVGTHHVAAGLGLPVILLIPGPMGEVAPTTIPGSDTGPVAIVVPTRRSLSEDLAELTSRGSQVFFLEEVVMVRDGQLVGALAAEKLLVKLRNQVLEKHLPRSPSRAWILPPGARWEELVFDFKEAQSLNVRFRGETRTFDPPVLGMVRKRSGQPTIQWTTLQSFAELDGAIGWKDAKANVRIKKQKQLLSLKLIDAFGLPGDPIVWDHEAGVYRTRFKISGTPLGYQHAREIRR
jgi:hypothetical protein